LFYVSFAFQTDATLSIGVSEIADYNFAERGAFDSRWAQETQDLAQLVSDKGGGNSERQRQRKLDLKG
jgi:hypothetical protein